ncbi:hypothetical protein SAMN05216526_0726 [Ectothiorhodosinus mongolicus]|uniref:DUF72 domain-containing protein n=1 Tax=Ectothiorhodosinus mongolicus TaxID=233100 RepID=A0A1R3VQH9_9GAMM|nr:hypothetical protein [Ectothiorhodosinus mongolicus]ULX56709.1 hypothetical protein CKX93_02690 [Ectothiorhodosinus mongolicus]SIT66942.1 hypothetical protein SAMN05216526_0726 [Ectothiorhodosinus mongolicus]
MQPKIRVGGWDWAGPQFQNGFYPADLPEDWQLPFYANEYAQVLLPQQRWQAASRDDWQEWRSEVSEGFGFYLQLEQPESFELAALETARAVLGPQLVGLVQCAGEPVLLASGVPVWSIAAPEASHRVWTADSGAVSCGPVGLLKQADFSDLRALRAQIEAFAGACESEEAVLFIDASPAALDQAEAILSLLGLA